MNLRARTFEGAVITTSHLIHECWALVQARLGWEAVDAWRERLASRCDIVWVTPEIHTPGEARCRQARVRRLSLTDSVSIKVMRRRGLVEAIAWDERLEREGFGRPPA